MSAVVIWRPEPLTAKLVAAARPAAAQYAALARGKAPSKRVAASMFVAVTGPSDFQVGAAHPLGILFEEGTGAHEIEGKKGFIRLADGSYVSGSVKHPGMPAKPFLKPTLPLWAPLYRRQAAGAFRGF